MNAPYARRATVKKPPKKKAPKKKPAKLPALEQQKLALAASPKAQALLKKVRAICLDFPEVAEVEAWGHPTFRAGGPKGKIFATFGGGETGSSMSMKTTLDFQQVLVHADPRFTIAHYVGKHGWVTFSFTGTIDWKQLASLVRASYKAIAPKKLADAV